MSPQTSAQLLERIRSLQEERTALEAFPLDELVAIIGDVGFSCDRCGRCCTREFNGHVLLFPEEAERIRAIDPSALEPPPVYDFCDQNGVLYVSGYTIRTLQDRNGSCRFLEKGKCQIYRERPDICRIYPYMLHREPDGFGVSDWRQISGLDQHGIYHTGIPREEAEQIARAIKRFEDQVLAQEIVFLEAISRYFLHRGLRHVRKRFDDQVRRLRSGGTVTVMVFHSGRFEGWKVQRTSTEPLEPCYPAE
jgi:Fe-S-cluster containining protein